MTTPNRGSKPKRSYLEKGPTREQVERRNLLKGKLVFSDDEDDDEDFSGPFSKSNGRDTKGREQEGVESTGPVRRISSSTNNNDNVARKRMSLSLSPKNLGKRIIGRSRAERNDLAKSDVGGYTMRRERPIETNTTRLPPQRSRSNMTGRERPIDTSTARQPPERSRSNVSGSQWSIKGEGRSLSPRQLLKRSIAPKQKGNNNNGRRDSVGLDDMRKSLMADKKHLDDLQSKFHSMDDDDESIDEETMLERVARRVAARRGKLQHTKTDGDELSSMQIALKRRQEMDREGDEGIGGLWAMGLKALERVYDDINSSKREDDE